MVHTHGLDITHGQLWFHQARLSDDECIASYTIELYIALVNIGYVHVDLMDKIPDKLICMIFKLGLLYSCIS